jgi:hypothetical protein
MEHASQPLDALLASRRAVAGRVAQAFAAHPDVTAVLVFGSVALGHVDDRSDVDLLVVCRDELLSPEDRSSILAQFGSGWHATDASNGWGDTGLFAVGDAGGSVDGIVIDLSYQTAPWIDGVLQQVIERGAITTAEMPFRPYTLAALIQRAWVTSDRDGLVECWRRYVAAYPALLKQNILRHFSPILREYAGDMLLNSERHLGAGNLIFFLNRAVDAMNNILFALNDVYDPSERRTERVILPTLSRVPDRFVARLTDVLEGPFDDAGALQRARSFADLADEVQALAQPYLV